MNSPERGVEVWSFWEQLGETTCNRAMESKERPLKPVVGQPVSYSRTCICRKTSTTTSTSTTSTPNVLAARNAPIANFAMHGEKSKDLDVNRVSPAGVGGLECYYPAPLLVLKFRQAQYGQSDILITSNSKRGRSPHPPSVLLRQIDGGVRAIACGFEIDLVAIWEAVNAQNSIFTTEHCKGVKCQSVRMRIARILIQAVRSESANVSEIA